MPDLPELSSLRLKNPLTNNVNDFWLCDLEAHQSLKQSEEVVAAAEEQNQRPNGVAFDSETSEVFVTIQSGTNGSRNLEPGTELNCQTVCEARIAAIEQRAQAVIEALHPKTVRFYNEDGSRLLYTAENVEFKSAATYSGATPTKAMTVSTVYTFEGWALGINSQTATATSNLAAVKQDMDVYAAFSESVRQYTITYKSEDGATTLGTELVDYQGNGTASGITIPPKASSAQYDYTPNAWSLQQGGMTDNNALKNIVADRTVFATYIATLRTFTVRYYNGSTLMYTDENVEYGSASVYRGGTEPTKAQTAQYNYSFVGWAASDGQEEHDATVQQNITADKSVYAAFSKTLRQYTVTFCDYNGNSLGVQSTVNYGANASYNGTTPTRASSVSTVYTFAGWSSSQNATSATSGILNNITANKTVYAAYSETTRQYTVTFYPYNGGTALATQTVNYGANASYSGETPTHGTDSVYAYKFLGWSTSQNATSATANVLNNIQADKDVYAAFEHIQYTVYFAAGDSGYAYTLNPSASTEYGDMITISDKTTTKSSTSAYRYEFKGWTNIPNQIQTDTQIPVWGSNSITLDETKFAMDKTAKTATLYPVFIQTANTITVNWRDWTGTILTTTEVNAGTTITAISFPSGVPSRMLGYQAQSSGTLSQVQYKYEPYGYYRNTASDPTGAKNNPAYGMGSFNITTPENDTGIVAANSIVNANSGCIEMTLVYSYSYYNVTLQLLSHDGSIVIWSLTDSTENISSTGNNVQKQKQVLSSICNTVSGTQSFSESSNNVDMLGVLMRSEFGYNYTGDNPPVPSGLSHTPQSVITSYMPLKQYFAGSTSDKSYAISTTNVIVASTGLHNGDNYFITLDDTSSNILAKMYVVYANSDSNAVLLPYLAKFSVAYMGLNRHIYQNSSNLHYIDRNDSPTAFTNLNNTSSTWANVVTPQDQSYTLYGWESQPSTMTNSDTSDTTYPVIMDSQDTSLVDERASVSTAITLSAHLGDTSMSYADVRAKATFDLGDFVSTDYLLYDNTDTAKNQNLISTRNSPFFAHMPVILFHAVYEHEDAYTWQDIVDMCNDGTYKDDTKLPLGTIVPLNVNASGLSCATQIANATDSSGLANLDTTNKTFTLHMCLVAKDEYVDYYNGNTTGTNKARNKTTWLSLDRIPGTERWYNSASSTLEWTSAYPHDVVDDCQTLATRVSAFGAVVGNAMVQTTRWNNTTTNGTYNSESCYLYVPSVNELCGASGLNSAYTGGFSTAYSNSYAIDSKEFELYVYQWHDSESAYSSWKSATTSYTADNSSVITGTRDNSTLSNSAASVYNGNISGVHAVYDSRSKAIYLAYHWGFCIGYAGVADADKTAFTVFTDSNYDVGGDKVVVGTSTVSGDGFTSEQFSPATGDSTDSGETDNKAKYMVTCGDLGNKISQYSTSATTGDVRSLTGNNWPMALYRYYSDTTYGTGFDYRFSDSYLSSSYTSATATSVAGNYAVRLTNTNTSSSVKYCYYYFPNALSTPPSTWGNETINQYYCVGIALVNQFQKDGYTYNVYRFVSARHPEYASTTPKRQAWTDTAGYTTCFCMRGISGISATSNNIFIHSSYAIACNMPNYDASQLSTLNRPLCVNGNRRKVWRGDYIVVKCSDSFMQTETDVMSFDVYQNATALNEADTSKYVVAYTPARISFPAGQNPFENYRYVHSNLTN